MLDKLTHERFAEYRNQVFRLSQGEDPVDLELIRVDPFPACDGGGHENRRQSFALVFRGPNSPLLPQATYPLAHPGFPNPLTVFLVPIGPDTKGLQYEAIFN